MNELTSSLEFPNANKLKKKSFFTLREDRNLAIINKPTDRDCIPHLVIGATHLHMESHIDMMFKITRRVRSQARQGGLRRDRCCLSLWSSRHTCLAFCRTPSPKGLPRHHCGLTGCLRCPCREYRRPIDRYCVASRWTTSSRTTESLCGSYRQISAPLS